MPLFRQTSATVTPVSAYHRFHDLAALGLSYTLP